MAALARTRRAAALALGIALLSGPLGAEDSAISVPVHVLRARGVALLKLQKSVCRGVFATFEDMGGRTLDRVLEEYQETPETRLSRIEYRDGARRPVCRRDGVYAFTSPGSLTVYVCPSFQRLAKEDTKAAANILIHEELHSLGAGEAPMPGLPDAIEITRRVEERCGR
jgi:hypothetical protein